MVSYGNVVIALLHGYFYSIAMSFDGIWHKAQQKNAKINGRR